MNDNAPWHAHIYYDTSERCAAEALTRAREQGKVRFVGFTGHKSPEIHLKMLETGFPFDAVQMPLNAFDASFQSFEQKVLPELAKRGIAALGMKPLTGKADCLKKNILTVGEALRYAMSLPVATTITGMPDMTARLAQRKASFIVFSLLQPPSPVKQKMISTLRK